MKLLFAALLLCSLAGSATAALVGDPRPAIGDLGFLEGHWKGESDDVQSEELWSAPQSGSVIAICREMKDGRTTFYEMLVVQELERGPVLRLKHFSETLVGREEKDKTADLPVVRVGKNEVVFESDDKERMTRLTYRRLSPTSLVAVLERKRDGKVMTDEFRYTLVK